MRPPSPTIQPREESAKNTPFSRPSGLTVTGGGGGGGGGGGPPAGPTVIVTEDDSVTAPKLSVATAVSLKRPSGTPFQVHSKGQAESAPSRVDPSKNSTRVTQPSASLICASRDTSDPA